jgi:hypothetical protein
MLQILKNNKKVIIIGSAAILLCVALIAALVSRQSPATAKKEDIPPGRIHDAGVLDDGGEIVVHDSTEGEIVIAAGSSGDNTEATSNTAQLSTIPSTLSTISDPEAIWAGDAYTGNHTRVD